MGLFENPLSYKRDNITGNYTRDLGDGAGFGLKLNFGRNDFFSSGQIPLDLVSDGTLPMVRIYRSQRRRSSASGNNGSVLPQDAPVW